MQLKFMKKLKIIFISSFLVLAIFGFAKIASALVCIPPAPAVTNAEYLDWNHDGQVDRIKLTFNQNIVQCNAPPQMSDDWKIDETGGIINNITGILNHEGNPAPCDGNHDYFYLTIDAPARKTGSVTSPKISYTNHGRIVGSSGCYLESFTKSVIDKAAPIILSGVYFDTDGNGQVDKVKATLSDDTGITFTYFDADWFVAPRFPNSINLQDETNITLSGLDLMIDAFGDPNKTGGPSDPLIWYIGGDHLRDGNGNNYGDPFHPQGFYVFDRAHPVIVRTVPAHASVNNEPNTSIAVYFSEEMDQSSIHYTSIPDPGGWSVSWPLEDHMILSHSNLYASGTIVNFQIEGNSKYGGIEDNIVVPVGTPVPNPWAFTIKTYTLQVSPTASSVIATPTTVQADNTSYSTVTVTVRDGTYNVPIQGKTVTLTSSRGGLDVIEVVQGTTNSQGQAIFRVKSATAGTSTISAIADGVTISQTVQITFTTAVVSPTADIKANNSDGPITITSGSSATITWTSTNATSCSVSPVGWTGTSGSQSTGPLSASQTYTLTCTGPGGTTSDSVTIIVGTAPVLRPGDLFKSPLSTTVYYYASNGKRYQFPTQATYFTWFSDWSGVKVVSHSQVIAIPFGGNIIAKPGTYLVQFVSLDAPFRIMDNKIYAVDAQRRLRHLTSEAVAAALYGSGWATKIVAVPEVFRPDYPGVGADIVTVSDYNKSAVENTILTVDDVCK